MLIVDGNDLFKAFDSITQLCGDAWLSDGVKKLLHW